MTTVAGPRVSVLLPAYNAERFVGDAIDSVLSQTFRDLELLVIDDGSTDATARVAGRSADGRLRVLGFDENRGLAHALNAGLADATGELIARLDADDVALPDRLERQVAFLDSNPHVVVVGTAAHRVDESGAVLALEQNPPTDTLIRWQSLFRFPLSHPTVVFRAAPVREHRLRYEPLLAPAEDFDFFSRLLRHGNAANIDVPLLRRRVHASQMSRTAAKQMDQRADEVAALNCRALDLPVTDEELTVAREVYRRPPGRFGRAEIRAVEALLRMVDALSQQPGIDSRQLRPVVRNLIDMTLVRALGRPHELLRSRMLWRALEHEPVWVMSSPVRWLTARAARMAKRGA